MDGEVGESQARAALARILASEAFRNAPRLAAFLSYVGERTLAGEGSALKGYTIATEALGRAADFDPQADPIVRVEAGRLRRALAAYYAGPGADDPVVVTIPLGRYVPTFRAIAAVVPDAPGGCEAAAQRIVRQAGRWRWLAPAATLALALTLGLSFAPPPAALSPDRPVLLVEGEGDAVGRMRAATAEALAQFGDLTILDGADAPGGANATYVLTLRATEDGALAAALRHRASGTVAWARRFAEAGPVPAPERVAAAVGGWRGALVADLASRPGAPGSRCLTAAAAALETADAGQRRAARTCLDRADADTALRARLTDDPAEALRLAHSALAHEPDGSATLGALAAARLASGDVDGGLAAALRAAERNPSDPLAAADLATAFLASGRALEAREAATRALLLDPRLAARPALEAAGTGRLAAASD